MAEWREARLGDVVELQRGFDLPSRERRPGRVPIVSSGGVSGTHEEARVQPPGVVTGRYGTLGEVFYLGEPFWPLNTTLFVKDFKGNDPRFVSYLLRTVDFLAYSDKAAVPGINRNHLHEARVSIPSLQEQRRIAAILGAFDDKIELNRRHAERLDRTARAIFHGWFIANPVAASWPVTCVADLFDVNPPRSLLRTEPAPYLGMANMPTSGPSALAVTTRIPGSGARFENGDTLLARITPCLENGKTALVDFLAPGERGWGSTEYIVLRPREPLPEAFAYCLARQPDFVSYAVARMSGSSGRQRVSAAAIGEFEMRTPPPELATRFGRVVGPMFTRITVAAGESRSLANMRDSLLPHLLSGQSTV